MCRSDRVLSRGDSLPDDLRQVMQGSNADYRGHVLGVIGDHNLPLSKVRDVVTQ